MGKQNISDTLRNMRNAGKIQDMKAKGNYGEDAVIALCYDRKNRQGHGLLYQGVKYPYAKNRDGVVYAGNIVYNSGDGTFKEYSSSSIEDEIDVLYITSYRVLAIEVKSYHATLTIDQNGWLYKNGDPVDKSPIAQAEKHARHLYHTIYEYLPDGNPDYIVPIVCFVDRCKLIDNRHQTFIDYVPACILNNLLHYINKYNTPLEYNLNLTELESKIDKLGGKKFD